MSAAWNDKSSTSWCCLEALPRREKKWRSLFSLRCVTIVCNIIAVVCFSWAMKQHYKGVVSTDGLGQAWAGINLGTSAYGLVWSTVFLIVVLFGCAVHPGVSIAFDSLAFCAQIITICFYLHELVHYQLGGYGTYGTKEDDMLYGVECLGCSVVLLSVTLNLILLVRASRVCHGIRKTEKNTKGSIDV